LAKNWSQFHETPLSDYATQTYNTSLDYKSILPEDVKYMLPYMMKGNWLVNYASPEGINRALSGMSRRTTFSSHMEEATEDLLKNYEEFKGEFMQFFPELQIHCARKITDLNQARA
jgi:acyl carrier protein phosphodiesterase